MKKHPAIRAFISYAAQFKMAFWLTASVFALANIVLAVVPWLIGQLAQSLTEHSHVTKWTTLVIAASVGHDLLWRTSEFLFLKLLTRREHRFDDYIFAAILEQPYSYFVDKFTGKISSYANTLGREFRGMLESFQYNYVSHTVTLPIIAATMFSVNLYTGVIFVVSLILMFVTGRKLARMAADAERKEADEHSTIDGYTVDAVANFVSVKAFGNERRERARMHKKREALIKAALDSGLKDIIFWAVMSFFIRWIIWPSTFILNVVLYTQGHIDLGQITTFLAAIVLFSTYIWEVVWEISQLNIKLASIDEAYRYLFGTRDVFEEPPAQGRKPLTESAFRQTLELRDLRFAYPDKPDSEVLHGINLTIRHGEKIGIVGSSGGGKSTLLKLLLGYYPVTSSQLLLDGQPVDNRTLTDLTAYVPQDTAVFHRPIRDNIAYGKPDATDDEIVAAARHAQAHDFISELDEGYDTLVGERGIKLSGGQRQRIAIARAILKGAPLLMLDEATSALDSESEKAIQTALWDLMKGRTAIIIAHRLSTIQKMDRIVVLDNGKIIEEGTHQALLKQNGTYARLWAHQSGGFLE